MMTVTYALGVEMLLVGGASIDRAEAQARLEATIHTGAALERFRTMVEAQGGDARVVDDTSLLSTAPVLLEHRADRSGVVAVVEPRSIGHAIVALGGGRVRTSDQVDPAVGFVIPVKPGDRIEAGDLLATVHARDAAGGAIGIQALGEAILIDDMGELTPLISHRVSAAGVEALT